MASLGMIRGAAALALLAVASLPSRAQETPLRGVETPAKPLKTLPETLGDAVGTWDMSLDGSSRRCELSLSADSGPDGRVLRFPAGCRRALPVLAEAAGWLFDGKGIRIVDRNVRPVIAFSPSPDEKSLAGRSEHGESYSLVPLQTVQMLPIPAVPPADGSDPAPQSQGGIPDVATSRDIPGSQPVLSAGLMTKPVAASPDASAPSRDGRPGTGIYALDRFNDKDVCRIALEARPSASKAERDTVKDLSPARILPGCHDGGIMVFDPVSWRFASGHLTLKARRGHAINLVSTGDGRWRRDPDTGTTLVLRRVEP